MARLLYWLCGGIIGSAMDPTTVIVVGERLGRIMAPAEKIPAAIVMIAILYVIFESCGAEP